MISNARYWFLFSFIVIIYIIGMFVTLFENDSAQYAVMAMRMFQENDFINIFKGTNEYLGKPHLHFWLAVISYKIFGIYDWAYRIPSFLITFLGAYSCYGLGRLLYNKGTGKLAALIFLTAQVIVVGVIDVRTDNLLTGFTIFAIWQLCLYIENRTITAILLGALGTGLAFSTSGHIAILIIVVPLLCHLTYTRKWKTFANWRLLIALLVLLITISPVLYAYYLQFDMHPEKIINGRNNKSGILFIFWEQFFQPLNKVYAEVDGINYNIFFDTFLWKFLPWSIIGIVAYICRVKTFFKLQFRHNSKYEFLTLGGISLIFLGISLNRFRFSDALITTIPLVSILSASYLYSLNVYTKDKAIKFLLVVQNFILGIVFLISVFITFYVFKIQSFQCYLMLFLLYIVTMYFCLKREAYSLRMVTLSVFSVLLLNAVLNVHYYPTLLKYQAGSSMSKIISENNIPVTNIYKLSKDTWSLDFYNQKPVKISSEKEIRNKKDIWVYLDDYELRNLNNIDYDWDKQYTVDQFMVTDVSMGFLNPATRKKTLKKMYLIHIY